MPRAVQLSWPSLAAPGFVAQVLQQLIDAGAVAKKLSIEWTEGAKPSGWQVLALATRDGRHLGVRIGVGHGASAPQQLMLVHDIGLDCVKVGPSPARCGERRGRAFPCHRPARAHPRAEPAGGCRWGGRRSRSGRAVVAGIRRRQRSRGALGDRRSLSTEARRTSIPACLFSPALPPGAGDDARSAFAPAPALCRRAPGVSSANPAVSARRPRLR